MSSTFATFQADKSALKESLSINKFFIFVTSDVLKQLISFGYPPLILFTTS